MAQTTAAPGPVVTHGGLSLGERVKLLRERLGYDQGDLAQIVGNSRKMIGRYERGESEPTATVLGRLALALRTSADYLVGLSDDPGIADPDSVTRVWINGFAQSLTA